VATSTNAIAVNMDGYALLARLALGIICLGYGNNAVGLSGMHI